MKNDLDCSQHEEVLKENEIYFTINLNGSDWYDDNDSASITSSNHDDYSKDDRIMRIVLENWLFDCIRNSQYERLTWDEVLSLFHHNPSVLLSSWYMSKGPEGLFHHFTTSLPGSKILCHNPNSYTTTVSNSTPPTRKTSDNSTPPTRKTSETHNDEHIDVLFYSDTQMDELNRETAENDFPDIVNTAKQVCDQPIVDLDVHDTNVQRSRCDENILSRDSNSNSLGSLVTYLSYADTNSFDDFVSIQSDNDAEDHEYISDNIDTKSKEHNTESIANDEQYCDYADDSNDDESSTTLSIASLSPMESPDYKNYSMKEIVLYPDTIRWNDIIHRHVTNWLLHLLQENSSMKLWCKFVEMEFINTFGITSNPSILTWIEMKLPEFTITTCRSDDERYLYETSTYNQLTIVWDVIAYEGIYCDCNEEAIYLCDLNTQEID